jgi:hypothetical protein
MAETPVLGRRGFLRGLIAAPAVIAIDRLMPVKLLVPEPSSFKDALQALWENDRLTASLIANINKNNALLARMRDRELIKPEYRIITRLDYGQTPPGGT